MVSLPSSIAAPTRGLIPGKQASPATIQLRRIDVPPPKQEPGWGEPVDGVSVGLATGDTNWNTARVPTFTLALRNQGPRKLTVFQLQETGRLEVDGIWYEWLGPGVWHRSPFPPGAAYEGIPISLSADWYPKQDTAINSQPHPYRPLRLTRGPHTVRFAVDGVDANARRLQGLFGRTGDRSFCR